MPHSSHPPFLALRTRPTIVLVLSLLLAAGALWLPTPGAQAGGIVDYHSTPNPGTMIDTGSAPVGQQTSTSLVLDEPSMNGGFTANSSVIGTNAGDFSAAPATVSVVNGQPKTLTITCAPSATGTRTANVSC